MKTKKYTTNTIKLVVTQKYHQVKVEESSVKPQQESSKTSEGS